MVVVDILRDAVERKASDIFFISGLPVSFKVNGQIFRIDEDKLTPTQTEEVLLEIYLLANERDPALVMKSGDDDFSFAIGGLARFRVNAYRQRGTLAIVIRIVTFSLPDPKELHIPEIILELSNRPKGLVLVTGSAGSGKSTTLACMINVVNQTQARHIITLEDPLEYLHSHKMSIVSQREVPTDTESYVKALRASLRQTPDVILLGEMRDYESINVAMTAAETGHLILSSLHTVGAANTIDRIIDAFPPGQQHQIRVQLAMVLQAVVSQQLLPTVDGKIVPAFEIMLINSAIRNMIRESKVHQIDSAIYSGAGEGMCSMDASILELYKKGIITDQTALSYSTNPETMLKKLS